MSDYLDPNNEELLKDFFIEAEMQVEKLESNILVIENDPSNMEAVDEIFRAAHTLKGGSATVEMHELSGFTHIVEDVLDEIRSGNIVVTEDVVNTLLSSIDIIKIMLETRADGSVYDGDTDTIKASLQAILAEKNAKKPAKKTPVFQASIEPAPIEQSQPAAASEIASNTAVNTQVDMPAGMPALSASPVVDEAGDSVQNILSKLSEFDLAELKETCPEGTHLWAVVVNFDESNPMNSVGGIQVFAVLKDQGTVLKTIPDFEILYEDEFHPTVIYFIATEKTADDLEDAAFLNDVTISTDAQYLHDKVISASSKTDDSLYQTAETQQAVIEESPAPSNGNAESVAQENPVSAESASAESSVDPVTPAPVAASADGGSQDVPQQKIVKKTLAQANSGGSVLRVESKRIDYLLNLVSETVISKASFNQTATQMTELQSELQTIKTSYKEVLRQLFDKISSFAEQSSGQKTAKELKNDIVSEYSSLFTAFDAFDLDFKSIATKFRAATQNLGRIASELQEGVMKIRMVPINQIFSRFPRVVRDLSRDLGKKVNLVIEGEDTEMDKSVIEDLLDPIMHCVRNSLDHGLEKADARLAAGKSEEGTVTLKASNEGNMVVIDIMDDGRGIDVERVRAKAISRGLISDTKAMSDHECFQLIFEPGFSTAEKITNVSGRGVGLDVVKTQIEKLNGTVMVSSASGKGSKFTIRLPLTLAIIQGLLVRVGSEVYSIPIASVLESHRITEEDVILIDECEVLNIRSEVISIIRLNEVFGVKSTKKEIYNFVVVVGTAEKKLGIVVDALIGEEDVVIKPLSDHFINSPGIAGASILGDGSVSLIIDVGRLLELTVKKKILQQYQQENALQGGGEKHE
ncbi:MAG: chemotaxis protein CheW [Treponemataceae bacterium]